MNAKNIKWGQLALISVAVSAIGGLSSLMSSKKERKIYTKQLKQAPWAPPAWLFAPAWMFNNFFILQALKRTLENKELTDRKKLLLLQAGIWAIFFSFNYIYFQKKSTVLASVWTQTDAVLALASLLLAWKHDKKLSANFIPLVAWTWYASSVAHYQAVKNPDAFLHTKALLN